MFNVSNEKNQYCPFLLKKSILLVAQTDIVTCNGTDRKLMNVLLWAAGKENGMRALNMKEHQWKSKVPGSKVICEEELYLLLMKISAFGFACISLIRNIALVTVIRYLTFFL